MGFRNKESGQIYNANAYIMPGDVGKPEYAEKRKLDHLQGAAFTLFSLGLAVMIQEGISDLMSIPRNDVNVVTGVMLVSLGFASIVGIQHRKEKVYYDLTMRQIEEVSQKLQNP